MSKYKIILCVNYSDFEDFIYNKLKNNNIDNYSLHHQSYNIVDKVLENSEEISRENSSIWKVIVDEIKPDSYIKKFTDLLNLKRKLLHYIY